MKWKLISGVGVALALAIGIAFAQDAPLPGQAWWAVNGKNLQSNTNASRVKVLGPGTTSFTQPWLDAKTVTGITDSSGRFTVTFNGAVSNVVPTFAVAVQQTNAVSNTREVSVASFSTGAVTFQVFNTTNGVNLAAIETNSYYVIVNAP